MLGISSGDSLGGGARLEHAHDVAFLHDDQLFAIELDLGARPLAEQNPVARLDVERLDLAVLAPGPRTGRNHLALHRLFLGRVGNDDAAGRLLLLLDAADHHAVVQRTKFHQYLLKPARKYGLALSLG